MEFKRRKIRSDRLSGFGKNRSSNFRLPDFKNSSFKLFTPRNTIIISAIVAFLMMFMGYRIIQGISLRNVVFFFGKDLQEDAYGHTNILLLGTGGEGHDGADLTDTIIVASINQTTNQVTLFSVPRDFYITDKKVGSMRINNLYFVGKKELGDAEIGLSMLKTHVEEIANVPIHYYLKVDFKGFKEIVDAVGGVDMDIPEAVYDPQYPRGEDIGYETFSIAAGPQHLDGTTALKYARSRHSTSDFDRSKRQQLLLYALKEKAEKEGILSDTGKLQDLYHALQSYLDTSLTLREVITLGKIGSQIKKGNIVTVSIHDDPTKCGGLLYTPARDLYNGASVLVPADKTYADIHNLTELNLNHPEIRTSGIKLQILNGTKGLGLAAESKIILNRLCLNVVRFGNGQSKDVATTTYYLKKEIPRSALEALQKLIPGTISTVVPQKYLELPYASDSDVVLELGADYLSHKMKDSFDGIVSLMPSAPVTGEAAPLKTSTITTPTTPATTPKSTPVPPKKK